VKGKGQSSEGASKSSDSQQTVRVEEVKDIADTSPNKDITPAKGYNLPYGYARTRTDNEPDKEIPMKAKVPGFISISWDPNFPEFWDHQALISAIKRQCAQTAVQQAAA
jgi:hypothetical protein